MMTCSDMRRIMAHRGATPAYRKLELQLCGDNAGAGKPAAKSQPTPLPWGPGPALHQVLGESGLSAGGCAECRLWAEKMNAWGIEGCGGEHRAEILERLRKAATNVGWVQKAWVGTKLLLQPWFRPTQPLESILDEALRRAETSP